MGNNKNLQNAKNSRYDEFYTTYETISSELAHYKKHFYNKTVLCNCDDPFESNFCKYFLRNFNILKLHRLICTSCSTATIKPIQLDLFTNNDLSPTQHQGYVLDVTKFCDFESEIPDDYISNYLKNADVIKKLTNDGNFLNEECVRYLETADIVVTNPPFSLFKDLVSILMQYKKKFLLIGNQNALTYKEIFPLIKNNKVWTGYKFGEMKFRVPKDSEPRKTRFWIDESGQKWRSLGNAMWLTNLDVDHHNKFLELTKRYTPEEYPTFDSFDAINVKKCSDIPFDYHGIMAVPITIIDKYNKNQFEIVGEANHGSDNEFDLFKPTINGKLTFKKILIRNKFQNETQN